MYTIEKAVPVPAHARGARNKYPLHLLSPGDSFFVKLEDIKQAKNLRSSMAVRAKKLNISIATVSDETGVRVWRTK